MILERWQSEGLLVFAAGVVWSAVLGMLVHWAMWGWV